MGLCYCGHDTMRHHGPLGSNLCLDIDCKICSGFVDVSTPFGRRMANEGRGARAEKHRKANLTAMKRAILNRLRGEFMGEAFARDFYKRGNRRFGTIKSSQLAFNARADAALDELVSAGELIAVEEGVLVLYRLPPATAESSRQ